MLSSAAHGGSTAAAEASSPELVLVDAALALRARQRLAEPEDTLARLERDLAFKRLTTSGPTLEASSGRLTRASRPASRGGRRPHRLRLMAVGVAVAVLFAGALLVGVQVTLHGTPAGADSIELPPTVSSSSSTTAQAPPSRTPATPSPAPRATRPKTPRQNLPSTRRQAAPRSQAVPRPSSAPGSTPAEPRRFAWAPVSGATGYRVEFFRDADLIYSVEVRRPHLELASSWTFRGQSYRLRAGRYRWYVWPVRSGRRDTQATVQADLLVR